MKLLVAHMTLNSTDVHKETGYEEEQEEGEEEEDEEEEEEEEEEEGEVEQKVIISQSERSLGTDSYTGYTGPR